MWRSVPAAVLLQELGELPLAVEWKCQALRFWSALTALPETFIFKQAAMRRRSSPTCKAGLLGLFPMCAAAWHGADMR